MRPSSDVDPSYFARFFRTPEYRARVSMLAAGANINNLRNEDLDNLPIPLPPLPEQRRIAAILDQADELRTQRRRALALLAELSAGLYTQMFHGGSWEYRPLGELLERVDGGTSPVCHDYPAAVDEWAVLKLIAVTSGRYQSRQNKAIADGFEPCAADEVQRDDVLLTRKNTPELVGASLYVFETEPKRLLPDLIFRLVVSDQGSNRCFSICVPPLALQQEFTARVREIEALRIEGLSQAADLDELFASLQDRAFRGEL